LRRAAELEPDRARYAYVYAVALHSAGHGEEAIAVLKGGLVRHPEDRDILLALITFNRDAGELPTALEYAERLAWLAPNDREVANLVRSLQDQIKRPNAQ
jgi:Flp pilus assembly protein TadD